MLALLLAIGGLFILQADAVAQGELTLEARAGFDGYYEVNSWLPVQVVVANEGKDVEGEIQIEIADGQQGRVLYTQPAILPTHSRKQFTLYVFIEGYARELTVKLVQDRKTLVERAAGIQQLAAEDFLCGVISRDPSALNYLAGLPRIGQGRIHVAHLGLVDIPSQGRALDSVDALILHDSDTSLLSDRQRDALRAWVASGGHLIICGGPNAIPTATGLGDLLPAKVNGTLTTSDVGTLGDYANAPFIVNVPAVVAQAEPTTGRVMAGKADLPLLIRRDLDQGQIDYLALDPDLEPMRTWMGNDSLWPKLFSRTTQSSSTSAQPNPVNIHSALSNIPSLDVPSVLLVIAFLFIYIIIVGPLNFLILRLVDKRALAWITIPVLILLFSCTAYVAGFATRGRRVIVSEIAIVRVQLESGMADIDGFVGLYSPTRRTYDVRLPEDVLVYRLGSPYYVPGGEERKLLTVERGPPTYVRRLEVDVGAMRSFAIYFSRPWTDVQAQLTLKPMSRGTYQVQGTISNRGNRDIRNGALVWGNDVVQIADLSAGGTEYISANFQPNTSRPAHQLINTLLGNYPATGQGRRESDRRREVLNSVLSSEYRSWMGPLPGQASFSSLTLLGWLDESPARIEVEGVASAQNSTTLLVASLPALSSDPNTLILPKGSLSWQPVGSGQQLSPYALYHSTVDATFLFQFPPSMQDIAIENLSLHVDTLNQYQHSSPPAIYIEEASTGEWQALTQLSWGQNDLTDPERFIAAGEIKVKVTAITIGEPLSIDFSAIGKR